MPRVHSVKRREPVEDTAGVAFVHRRLDNGPLHDLLLKACPPNPGTGEKSIRALAELLGISKTAVHNWIADGHLPGGRAFEIVHIADGRVSLEDFKPYVTVVS
jgi:hypothetical protein